MGQNKTIRLKVIAKPDANASIIASTARPAIDGDAKVDTLCGACGDIIGKNISPRQIGESLNVSVQLVLRCAKCGAHNLVPTTPVAH
jgi:hypothetical protein